MEFKTLVYLVIGIAYFIYSFYKKAKEEQSKNTPRPTPGQSASSSPKPENWLDETIKKIQQEAQKVSQQSQQSSKRKSSSLDSPKSTARKSGSLVTEMAPARAFEEGEFADPVYERPLTSEEILHNERMKAAQNVAIETSTEEEHFTINAREAFIGSLIFERKF